MPTYTWNCRDCGHEWDVVTSIADRDTPSGCSKCPGAGVRSEVYLLNIDKSAAGDWNNVSYNPGLGEWTKSNKHGREIAKARGLVEVGDEPLEKLQKAAETRHREIRDKRWEEATKPEAIREVLG